MEIVIRKASPNASIYHSGQVRRDESHVHRAEMFSKIVRRFVEPNYRLECSGEAPAAQPAR